MVLLEQYTAYSVSVLQWIFYLVPETQPNEVVGPYLPNSSSNYDHVYVQARAPI